jgi:hypothetical protein
VPDTRRGFRQNTGKITLRLIFKVSIKNGAMWNRFIVYGFNTVDNFDEVVSLKI